MTRIVCWLSRDFKPTAVEQDRVFEELTFLKLGIFETPSEQIVRESLRVVAVFEIADDRSSESMCTRKSDLMLLSCF